MEWQRVARADATTELGEAEDHADCDQTQHNVDNDQSLAPGPLLLETQTTGLLDLANLYPKADRERKNNENPEFLDSDTTHVDVKTGLNLIWRGTWRRRERADELDDKGKKVEPYEDERDFAGEYAMEPMRGYQKINEASEDHVHESIEPEGR